MKPPPVALGRHTHVMQSIQAGTADCLRKDSPLAKLAGEIRSLSTRESETLNLIT